MTDLDLSCSPRIIIGPPSRIGTESIGRAGRALLIADAVLDRTAAGLQAQLDSWGMETILFTRDGLVPDTATLDEVLSLARGSHSRLVVALGGEKVMSLGRLLSAAAPGPAGAADLIDGTPITWDSLGVVTIPSSGRHSLLFRREAMLSDPDTGRCLMVSLPIHRRETVFFDPTLTAGLSRSAGALSITAVLAAACEAYLSPRANFFSETQAAVAVRNTAGLIRELAEDEPDSDSRLRSVQCAILTAFATGLTVPGPGLLLGWAAAATAGVSRAAAQAILLPRILESPLCTGSPRFRGLAQLLSDPDLGASDDPVDEYGRLVGAHGIPGRLRDLGVELENVLPAAGSAVAMAGYDRAELDESLFRSILESAF